MGAHCLGDFDRALRRATGGRRLTLAAGHGLEPGCRLLGRVIGGPDEDALGQRDVGPHKQDSASAKKHARRRAFGLLGQ